MAINCWEFLHCGRQPGGSNVSEFGHCPASVAEEHTYV
ncbi:MAG: two-CW domain-containing protein, partial [Phycisphaerae bacterium]